MGAARGSLRAYPKGSAWFADSVNGNYNNGYVAGLPRDANTNAAWALGNLLHAQANLSPANIFYLDVLTNFDHQSHFGLGALDPESTTSGRSDREWLLAAKDSHSWFGGSLVEAGLAWQAVYHRMVPEGTAPYLVTPEGRSGNYFVDSRQDGSRGQAFVNYFPRVRTLRGRHQLQIGSNVQRLDYSARFTRSRNEVIGLAGLPEFVTTFRVTSRGRRAAALARACRRRAAGGGHAPSDAGRGRRDPRRFRPDALQTDVADFDALRLPAALGRLPVLRRARRCRRSCRGAACTRAPTAAAARPPTGRRRRSRAAPSSCSRAA